MANRYTRQELEAKPIHLLKLVHIQDKEEEDMVQEILDAKLAAQPKVSKIVPPPYSTNDLTPAKEAELQAKLDALNAEKEPEQSDVASEVETPKEEAPVEETAVEPEIKSEVKKKAKKK